jgi:hypothetical protein
MEILGQFSPEIDTLAHDWQEKSRNWPKITGPTAEFE